MKLFHISDLHIGKKVNGFSMLEDQRYIFGELFRMIGEERPDALLIAGDIYDTRQPSAEAVSLFDAFLKKLAGAHADFGMDTYMISGNHDSPERLSYAASLIDAAGIHISPVYDGSIAVCQKEDGYGNVNFYLLPFLRPSDVRTYFPEDTIVSYEDAIRTVIRNLRINPAERNVILSHQFVTGAKRSESEEIIVGGLDNISAALFDEFDYAALGHIHGPQDIVPGRVRYCGTPLKYSFSEKEQQKSVTMVELGEKGAVSVHHLPLRPERDMREIRGKYDEVMRRENYAGTNTDDYVKITLTDEEDVPGAIEKLRVVYPNIMQLVYDNRRTRGNAVITGAENVEEKSPGELFEEFYRLQNNQEMSEDQKAYVQNLIREVWGI